MAKPSPKTSAAKTAAAPKAAPKTAPVAEAPKDKKVPLSKMRGPRGVAETAKITLLVPKNPKREGSKAYEVFSLYKNGMTVGKFCDAVDATENKGAATPNLVYDANHGFIAIEGYTPPNPVTAKPKAEKKDAEPKGKPVARGAKKAKADEEAEEENL